MHGETVKYVNVFFFEKNKTNIIFIVYNEAFFVLT
jgi:hypothetical protein